MPEDRTMPVQDATATAPLLLPINQIVCGHAAEVMVAWPSKSIDLIITSPPYWDAVIYDGVMPPWRSDAAYLNDLLTVWVECARVLRPNGKLCVNAMMMPLPKEGRPQQYTRRLEDIPGDIGRGIVEATGLERFDPWAPFRSSKAAVKLHTLLDLRGNIPSFSSSATARCMTSIFSTSCCRNPVPSMSWTAVTWLSSGWRASKMPVGGQAVRRCCW